jgi:hypothetical protein
MYIMKKFLVLVLAVMLGHCLYDVALLPFYTYVWTRPVDVVLYFVVIQYVFGFAAFALLNSKYNKLDRNFYLALGDLSDRVFEMETKRSGRVRVFKKRKK